MTDKQKAQVRFDRASIEMEAAQKMCNITYTDWQDACAHMRRVEAEHRCAWQELMAAHGLFGPSRKR